MSQCRGDAHDAPVARRVVWKGGDRLPDVGELGRRITEHCEAHQRADADDWMKNITVQLREGAGYDLRATPGKARRQSRLRGLFKRDR